jgi:hypothetical protein
MKTVDPLLKYEPRFEEALADLRKSLVKGLSKELLGSTPKVLLKATLAYECLVRRTVDIAEGISFGLNTTNLVVAFTMGRSLIETAAILSYLTDGIETAIESGDLMKVDRLLQQCLFGSRHPTYQGIGFGQALNVLTLIEKLDRSIFGKGKEPQWKEHYEYLSEFAHPNGAGLIYLNAEHLDPSNSFFSEEEQRGLLVQVKLTLVMITIVNSCRLRFQKIAPTLRALCGGSDPQRSFN